MNMSHSAVITETCHKMSADITIIVHSDDENVTRVIHDLCSSAVKRAVGPLDLPEHGYARSEDAFWKW